MGTAHSGSHEGWHYQTSWMSQARDSLRNVFGHDEFLPGQEEVLERVLAGRSTLAIFPTGAGKSLCYQLPAVLLEGTVLVVSPLKALMKDQVDALGTRGIKAARLDSSLPLYEATAVLEDFSNGKLDLLYVAPERFATDRFRAALDTAPISLLAIDESHCISEWGHDFRPEYLRLANHSRTHNFNRVLCLTATATKKVEGDLCAAFRIKPENVIRKPTYRKNLSLGRKVVADKGRMQLLFEKLRSEPKGPTIVYVTKQKASESVAQGLQEAGFDARAFHAGLPEEEKKDTQEWFKGSRVGIVVATIAFGMGVDKPDIRRIVHFNLPKSIEGYLQEIGRAGRDGESATCEILACPSDVNLLENLLLWTTPSIESFHAVLERIFSASRVEVYVRTWALEYGFREEGLKSLMARLEDDGWLLVHSPRTMKFEYRLGKPIEEVRSVLEPPQQKAFDSLLQDSDHKVKWSHLDLRKGSPEGFHREGVDQVLDEFVRRGLGEVRRSQFVTPYEILKRPPDMAELAASYHARFAQHEERQIERLHEMVRLLTGDCCIWQELSGYVGDPPHTPCGHCPACHGVSDVGDFSPRPHPPNPDEVREWVQAAVERSAEAVDKPLAIAQCLCGVYSSGVQRLGLHFTPGYRELEAHSLRDVKSWVEKQLTVKTGWEERA